MPDSTYKQAAGLIREAERVSNFPVRVTWDDTLQVGAVLHLSEAQWSKQLRISVKPARPDIPYLVGVQCALAVRHSQSISQTLFLHGICLIQQFHGLRPIALAKACELLFLPVIR